MSDEVVEVTVVEKAAEAVGGKSARRRVQRKDAAEGGDGKTQQSLRVAALNKFRMKRKDKCFDKKVRYESRKKLAEQRPRIKGQFVRQVQSTETSTQAAPQ
ncbi:hypothetical protein F2Q70_00000409 [Brassica cretica]|uniref:CCT domain-containing protein n=1 Tax=Brassica cretica TaxID=69181 RepID=A0A8S9IWM8_BRACR|nr:hypothetical protein F2Q70_00000409 [Brassica cretica]